MNRIEILECLTTLAERNDAYERLLKCWIEYDMLDETLALLEEAKLNDIVDLILYIEGVN